MPKFEKHLFICCNQREPGHPRGCCDPTGQAQLQFLFKQKLALRGFKKRVRANMSGCLDQCEHGPTVVVYPDAGHAFMRDGSPDYNADVATDAWSRLLGFFGQHLR